MDKLRIKEFVIALLIAGCFILFAPDKFLDTLGLRGLRNTYKGYIGAGVLICAIFCIIWALGWIKKKIVFSSLNYMRVSRGYLKKIISTEEKEFLIRHFYNSDTNEFNSTAKLDITSGNILLLSNANIITQASKAANSPSHWAFCLQPNVRIYLNKAIKKGKIVVNRNGYKWNL